MSAAECFINFMRYHSAQESRQVQSTTQLSLVQHKEREKHPVPLPWLNLQSPTSAPKSCQQPKGADPQGEGLSSTVPVQQ